MTKAEKKIFKLNALERDARSLRNKLDKIRNTWEDLNNDIKENHITEWKGYCDNNYLYAGYSFSDVMA